MLLIMFAAALVGAATAVNFTDCGGPNATLRFCKSVSRILQIR